MNAIDNVDRNCRNCDAGIAVGQSYCGACGQKCGFHRLTLHEIGHDLVHALIHVDRSALSLLRMLLAQPGTVARSYVQGKRKRYFGPLSFLAVVVAAASAVNVLTGFRPIYSNSPNAIVNFLQSHMNLLVFAEVPLLAAISRLLDLRGPFNLAEHLVLVAYTSSLRIIVAMLVLIPVWYVFRAHHATALALPARLMWTLNLGATSIWALYFGFATSQFLSDGKARSWCKGILAAVLASVSLQVLVSAIASLFGSVSSARIVG